MKNLKLKFDSRSSLMASIFILLSILLFTSFSINTEASSILQAINNAASAQTGGLSSGSNTSGGSILQNVNTSASNISSTNSTRGGSIPQNVNSSVNNISSNNSFVSRSQSCSIPYTAGRIIVNFSNTSILSDRGAERSQFTVNANIPAGTYLVTLYGYNEYANRVNVSQPNERYYVRLSNGVTSNSLSDLPDHVILGQRTEVVNNSLVVSNNVTSVTAVHSVYPDSSSPNSITLGCAAFDLISATTQTQTQTLNGSCSVSPNSINSGGYLNWTASASGGNSSYSYSWTGTDGLYGNSSYVSKPYSTAGTKTGTVTITSGTQSISRDCSAIVTTVVNNNLSVSCNVGPSTADVDEDVDWSASAYGGTGSYSYDWSGTDSLSGSRSNITWSYNDAGTKRGIVTVTSGGESASASCTTRVVEEQSYNDLNVSCYASPSYAQTGSRVNWYANVYGGDGDYDYDWTGTDGLDSSSRSPSMTYYNIGNKRATVRVEDGSGRSESTTCYANVNSVLAYTEGYQPPMASAVYLSQIPYTGVKDNLSLAIFIGLLSLFSVWISYIIISFKRNNGELI